MNEVVVDSSVILKWFARQPELRAAEAEAIRSQHLSGVISLVVPPLLFLEVINIAARRWRFAPDDILRLADMLEELEFEVASPALRTVAAWTALGLSAYDATYVALAEERGVSLVTEDRDVIAIAPEIARALAP